MRGLAAAQRPSKRAKGRPDQVREILEKLRLQNNLTATENLGNAEGDQIERARESEAMSRSSWW